MKKPIKAELLVQDTTVSVVRLDSSEYLSLTDMARWRDPERSDYLIQNWMRNGATIEYLGLWETFHNPNFNSIEFDGIKAKTGQNSFSMTPKRWAKELNGIGVVSKTGRYSGGVFAHQDIALEFASWLSAEFKFYLVREFERLKKDESYRHKIEWSVKRELAKTNYIIHTDAIKANLIPTLTEQQKKIVYADEADVLNVALFGQTAKEWREQNPELDGNMRDYADILHLVVLSNMENLNAEMIKDGILQGKRLVKLNETAKHQLSLLRESQSIKRLGAGKSK